ncbi:MAG: tetraacyldisaccharide 4'-kinase [Bacteroidota bacterium]
MTGTGLRELLFKVLLSPVAILYGLGITVRNQLYDQGILKSTRFSVPVIGIGNLTVGGAGKTPHVEYLIRLLSPYLEMATLSRGYKRKTRGFRIIRRSDDALTAGDEPLQYFLKYKQVKVAVSESRSLGIPLLMDQYPETQVILLDDSYQHRSVTPAINILLTEYSRPYSTDQLLPVGRLREWKSAADRADIVIVTKCPEDVGEAEMSRMSSDLQLESRQQLYFSKYIYGSIYHLLKGVRGQLSNYDEIILITAIANESYLLDYVRQHCDQVYPMSYEDHHIFSAHDLSVLGHQYRELSSERKCIITTEKDATRLFLHKGFINDKDLPIYILPIAVEFLGDKGVSFNTDVRDRLLAFQS